jgi:NAD(P)-dependent dehydrogenase (short-subunit alcohol dehydrogenase family)
VARNYLYKPTDTLLWFSGADGWTLDDAYMGAFIFGGTGSGKSSGSGRALAHAFLRAGFGGLVLCAKPGEAELWTRYARKTGRESSLIILGGKGERRFNFLEYELSRIDGGGSSTPFALEALLKVYEAMQAADGVKADESFWRNSVRLLLSHSIDALYAAHGRLRFPELMDFIHSAARDETEFNSPEWRQGSFHFRTLERAAKNPARPADSNDMAAVLRYFRGQAFAGLDAKTKTNIIATLEAMVMDFQKGELARIFCTDTTTVPEMSHYGAVIVLDFPLKIWQRGGMLAQHIFKYAWQRATERRQVDANTRPCFLWADEYQLFASSYDAEFQSTARSSRACTVYMTQSVPALRDAVRSTLPHETINALLNNFQTAIIHACRDSTTQNWAADSIGKGLQYRQSWNHSQGTNWSQGYSSNSGSSYSHTAPTGTGQGGSTGGSWSQSSGESWGKGGSTSHGGGQQEVIDYLLQPAFFGTGLRMGGWRNGYRVDGVVTQTGRIWQHNSAPWLLCSFKQR